MAEQPRKRGQGEQPRSDLPPKKEPYYEGYFGTEEEQGVEREAEDRDAETDEPARREDPGGTGEGPI
jgi:hypothetical protein